MKRATSSIKSSASTHGPGSGCLENYPLTSETVSPIHQVQDACACSNLKLQKIWPAVGNSWAKSLPILPLDSKIKIITNGRICRTAAGKGNLAERLKPAKEAENAESTQYSDEADLVKRQTYHVVSCFVIFKLLSDFFL